jgi:hypothetical protein
MKRRKNREVTFTAQAYLPDRMGENGWGLYAFLSETADLYNRIKRTLHGGALSTGKPLASFKNAYLKRFGITARQFNAVRFDLEGNLESAKEVQGLRIQALSERIRSVRKWLKSKDAQIRKIRRDKNLSRNEKKDRIGSLHFRIHQKKRKLHALSQKLSCLEKDRQEGRIRICFGSKALFHKQFNLPGNHYALHEEWVQDWREARACTFMMLGSKDETGGNQTCTLLKDEDAESITARVRVPDRLVPLYGRYVCIEGITYPYGHTEIEVALAMGSAITHRFVKGKRGWYLHSSVELPKGIPKTFHPRQIGCIGVDVNENGIAIAETDRFGNYVWSRTYPACVKDRSGDQTEALYGEICKAILNRAVLTGKPIAREDLDFSRKKATLKEEGVAYSRMLSCFAYATFLTFLARAAYKNGVEVFTDNAAYTSIIGKVNFMARYGISPHEAAAVAIARRIQGYSEAPDPSRTAIPLPVRNRGMHVWNVWRQVKGSGAGEQHHRLFERRSLQDSTAGGKPRPPSSRPPQLIAVVSAW